MPPHCLQLLYLRGRDIILPGLQTDLLFINGSHPRYWGHTPDVNALVRYYIVDMFDQSGSELDPYINVC
jgi:hypothetical protein